MSGFDILGLGSVALDELLTVDSYPPPDRKTRVLRSRQRFGGLTGGALIAAARLGARCAYAGRLGFDPTSLAVEAAFAEAGIDTGWAPRATENGVGRSTIVVATSQPTRNVFSQHTGMTGAHESLPPGEVIRSARVLLVDHHGVEGGIRAARIAREAGNSVVADFERNDSPRFEELVKLVDHLILPEDFACRIRDAANAEEAVNRLRVEGRQVVIVTAGERGCWFTGPGMGEVSHAPAWKVEAIDTTGCGDIFHGAYAAALARGANLRERIRFASAASAFKASACRDSDGVPRAADIEEMYCALSDK